MFIVKLLEASNVLREIAVACPELEGKNFLLMIPERTLPQISKGYEVILRKNNAMLGKETEVKLHSITKSHALKILEAQNTVAIYTPNEES